MPELEDEPLARPKKKEKVRIVWISFVALWRRSRAGARQSHGRSAYVAWRRVVLRRRDGEALAHAQTAVRLDPMEATLQQALGLVHYYGRRFDEAAAAERRALELRRQLPFARVMLIKSLVMNGDHRDAVRVCDEAETAASGNVDILVNCAIALHRAGDARAGARAPRPAAGAQAATAIGAAAVACGHRRFRSRRSSWWRRCDRRTTCRRTCSSIRCVSRCAPTHATQS